LHPAAVSRLMQPTIATALTESFAIIVSPKGC